MQFPESRKTDLIVSEIDAEILIYDQKTNKAFCLNQTSALIWKLCDGRRSLADISRALSEALNAEVDEGLVWLALEQLKQSDLIEHDMAAPASISGLSRRQALRKIGVAAAITLPLVSSIVAPTPINAASPTNPIFAPIPLGPVSVPVPRAPAPIVPPIFAPIPLAVFP
jgi:hypothetical protein